MHPHRSDGGTMTNNPSVVCHRTPGAPPYEALHSPRPSWSRRRSHRPSPHRSGGVRVPVTRRPRRPPPVRREVSRRSPVRGAGCLVCLDGRASQREVSDARRAQHRPAHSRWSRPRRSGYQGGERDQVGDVAADRAVAVSLDTCRCRSIARRCRHSRRRRSSVPTTRGLRIRRRTAPVALRQSLGRTTRRRLRCTAPSDHMRCRRHRSWCRWSAGRSRCPLRTRRTRDFGCTHIGKLAPPRCRCCRR